MNKIIKATITTEKIENTLKTMSSLECQKRVEIGMNNDFQY